MTACSYYDDGARRCTGTIASRFAWDGVDYCVVAGPTGLVVRETFAVTESDSETLGFGAVDEDMSADLGDIVERRR